MILQNGVLCFMKGDMKFEEQAEKQKKIYADVEREREKGEKRRDMKISGRRISDWVKDLYREPPHD